MRAGGVDDADPPVFSGASLGQRDRLNGGVVMQAQNGEIGGVERIAAGGWVLAARVIQRDQGEFAAARQPVGDFEAGGARRAVDENLGGHAGASASWGR